MSSAALKLEPIPLTPAEIRRDEWRRIEREAKDQALAEVDALEMTPLVFGDFIAWSNTERYATCGITEMHRVGLQIANKPYTACSEPIPHPLRWLPLQSGLVKTMPRCRFCQDNYACQLREQGEIL